MTDKIENGEFKEETTPKKTAMQELKDKIAVFQKLSLAWTIISLLFSTAFLIYSVFAKFGNPIYRYVSLGALGIYVLIFLSLFIFAVEGKKKKRMLLKTYKTGISVFKAILNVIHTVLTISVVLSSVSGSEINKVVSLLVAILTILFAALTIVFKLVTLILTNVIPKLAKLGAQIAKEAIDEKIKESKTLTNIVTYAKNRSVKKKAKAERKRQKEEAAAEKKRLKEERKADKLAKNGESATSSQTAKENSTLTDVNQSATDSRNSALSGDGKTGKRSGFFRKVSPKTIDKVACDVTNFNETVDTSDDNKAKKKVLGLFKFKKETDSSKD